MKNIIKYSSIIIIVYLVTSCDNFQDKLFTEIELREVNKIKSDTFNLDIITNFKWDSCLYVRGNESVPELKEFIEETLNNKKSKISWEDRESGVVDKTLKYKSEDLPVDYDRFYFLTPEKEIITKDIDHYGLNKGKYFELINFSKDTSNKSNWFSRKNSKIVCD
jgi:hypothetical protein